MPKIKNRIIDYGTAVNEALIESGKKNKSVIFLAQGITDPSAVYGTTKNLKKFFSKERIIELPLSENATIGIAVGAAMIGKRPVVSFHRVEFALLAMEQISNNAAKMHYVTNGAHKVPIVIRLIVGRGWGQGPAHSQSLENIFASFPGIKVIMPAFAAEAKGMLISAIEDNNPVIMIEHRWNHYLKGKVPKGYYKENINKPNCIKKGKHITVVTSSIMVTEVIEASKYLEEMGISLEIYNLRVIRPLNLKEIYISVKKTHRLMTIDIGFVKFGIGSEIVADVLYHCFNSLKSKPIRLGLPDHPIPSSRGYIKNIYPNSEMIIIEVCKLLKVNKKTTQDILKKYSNSKKISLIDVPNLEFKGPF